MVTSSEYVFFSGEFAVHVFLFWTYDVCTIFKKKLTLELFCVFRNTEYNGSKCAHFSL